MVVNEVHSALNLEEFKKWKAGGTIGYDEAI